jgi:sigma-B regulation protein RsbU (phosphoserine phosphatase)
MRNAMVGNAADANDLHCMEVWGGNGSAENCFARPGLDVWVWSKPVEVRHAVGNDVHLLSSCASGRITRALLADICGPGAVLTELGEEFRDLLMRNVNAIKQSRVIQEMSTRLRDFSDKGGFASVLVSTYFAPTRSLAICNAGHPPPLMFRAQENTWSVLKRVQNTDSANDNASPGVLSEDEFQEFSTHLSDGDMVLCYSNSLTECRDANGRTMGVVGLLERVRKVAVEHPSDIVGELTRTIQDEHLDNFCEQDATIILSRASTTRVGLKNNLLAPFRLLCRVSDNTHLG